MDVYVNNSKRQWKDIAQYCMRAGWKMEEGSEASFIRCSDSAV